MARSSTVRGSRGLLLIALAVSSAALLMAALPAAMAGETVQLRGSRSLLANTSPAPKLLFPPGCNCDRKQKNSPYRMEIDKSESYPVEIPTGKGGSYTLNRYCFRVDYEWGCDPRQKCCGKLGLHKIELDVVASCKGSLAMVTIDGERRSFEYNDRLSVLRVSQLGKDFYSARGTELCLFLKPEDECPTLNEMCSVGDGTCQYALFTPDLDCCPVGNTCPTPQAPPPPAPSPPKVSPPPTDFPRCNCKRDPEGSRMFTRLSYMTHPNETEHDGLTRVCFEVNTKDYCTKYNSPCCEFDLYKLEMEVVDDCKDALAFTTVNGAKKAPFYQLKPWPAIKVTNINKSFHDADGTEVCVYLRPTNQCNTLSRLCPYGDGTCVVGLFNTPGGKSTNCCPLSWVKGY